jgi:putative membrane protein
MPAEDPTRDPRVYLAAERTFLAWIRTGLALMAFGFVVARFGLFLRELASARGRAPAAPSVLSLPLGVGLVLIGVVLNIVASLHHVRYVQQLNEGKLIVGRPSRLAIALALILAAAGLALAIYLAITSARNALPNTTGKQSVSTNPDTGCIGAPCEYSVSETIMVALRQSGG